MWPFKKRYPPIDQLPDNEWTVAVGDSKDGDGKRMILRYNHALCRMAGHPDYSHQVGVAIPLRNPMPNGLPGKEEGEQLNAIENKLDERLTAANQAVYAFVLSCDDMREFVYYTSHWQATREKIERLNAEITSHELQIVVQYDPKWTIYREYKP